MAAKSADFANPWTAAVKKCRATVANEIWPEMLFFAIIATMVSLVSARTSFSLAMPNQMVTGFGTVLGQATVFRIAMAFSRFSEGRKLWTNIANASRDLAQIIWIHAPLDRTMKTTREKVPVLNVIIEKKSMIQLVQAFSVSVKHSLRGERGAYYDDLYPLISFLPRFAPKAREDMLPIWEASRLHLVGHGELGNALSKTPRDSNDTLTEVTDAGHPENHDPIPALPSEPKTWPARNPPQSTIYDVMPFLRILKPFFRKLSIDTRGPYVQAPRVSTEAADCIPLEITLYLSNYFTHLLREGALQPASATAMLNAIKSLQDSAADLQRITNTQLPFAYRAHLKISAWFYLLFLPSQLYSTFKYLSIPATVFASFVLLGLLEVGHEIENPFSYGPNDRELDNFCLSIWREMHEITAHTMPEHDAYIYTHWNKPLAPCEKRTAKELVDNVEDDYHHPDNGMSAVRSKLLQNWRTVEAKSRTGEV